MKQFKTSSAVMGMFSFMLTIGWGCGSSGSSDTDASQDTEQDPTADTLTDPVDDTSSDPLPDSSSDSPDDSVAGDVPEDTLAGDVPGDAVEEVPACVPGVTPTGDEGHRAGQDCLSCHATMGGSRRWTIAGTLYSDASGSAAVGGATVLVTDATGSELSLVTHNNGNFYTTSAVTFPLDVAVSKCPDTAEMLSGASVGSCNSCHDSSFRIHLP